VTVRNGLRLFSPAAAFVKVPEAFFKRYSIESQVALASIGDASEVLRRLLDGGHSVIAGRLAGAFRRIGRAELAVEITSTMKAAGYAVSENDPFASQQSFGSISPTASPIVGRIRTMWKTMRGTVIEVFPKSPGLPKNKTKYLKSVDEIYKNDAYHSLSIEGYIVSPELIDRVRAGNWDPDQGFSILALWHSEDERKGGERVCYEAAEGVRHGFVTRAAPNTTNAPRRWPSTARPYRLPAVVMTGFVGSLSPCPKVSPETTTKSSCRPLQTANPDSSPQCN
jgi:hypothetical protein